MSTVLAVNVLILVAAGVLAAVGVLAVRRLVPGVSRVDPGPWSSTLSYVATAYGVVVGFSILFLFGGFADARHSVGDEATSIGTAFEETSVFGQEALPVQQALICYADAVTTFDWPAMQQRQAAPEVDSAYSDLVHALESVDAPLSGTFGPAVATNVVVQVGNISTAREARLVTARTQLPVLLWGLLLGGGVLVTVLISVVTMPATPRAQALLVGLATAFTAILVLLVFALNNPYAPGQGRVSPALIADTAVQMTAELPSGADASCLAR